MGLVGTQEAWYTMRLRHNGMGTQWAWYTMRHNRPETRWDGGTMGLGQDTLNLIHNGIGTPWASPSRTADRRQSLKMSGSVAAEFFVMPGRRQGGGSAPLTA